MRMTKSLHRVESFCQNLMLPIDGRIHTLNDGSTVAVGAVARDQHGSARHNLLEDDPVSPRVFMPC